MQMMVTWTRGVRNGQDNKVPPPPGTDAKGPGAKIDPSVNVVGNGGAEAADGKSAASETSEQEASASRPTPPVDDDLEAAKAEDRVARAKLAKLQGGPLSWKSVGALVVVGGGLVYLFNYQQELKQQEREGAKELPSIGRPLLGGPWTLVDTEGKPVTDESFFGKHALIYFGFTHCPDVCPDELDKIAAVYDDVQADPQTKDRLHILFITIDPSRDTVGSIKQYLTDFHPAFVGLTGTEGQVGEACKQYRVYFSKGPEDDDNDYLVDHTIISYLVDDKGVFKEYYPKSCKRAEMTEKVKGWITGRRDVMPA